MKRLSKKEIQAAIDKLKDKPVNQTDHEPNVAKLPTKKTSQRIRKQGV
jgi:hypothetical protein